MLVALDECEGRASAAGAVLVLRRNVGGARVGVRAVLTQRTVVGLEVAAREWAATSCRRGLVRRNQPYLSSGH